MKTKEMITHKHARNFGFLFLFSFLLAAGPASAQLNWPPDAGFRDDRILVKPIAGVDLAPLHALLGTQVLRAYPNIGGLQVLELPLGAAVDGAIAVYRQSGLVQYAERDLVVQAFASPNDAYFADGSLWGLNNIGQLGGKPDGDIDAPEAWDITHDASGIVVAVIDTGVRATHEDLAANMWVNPGETGTDFLGRDKRFNGMDDDGDGYIDDVNGINAMFDVGWQIDDHGHGTHVAGTIGAIGNNSVGVVGVAWRVQIMACKFLNAVGDGSISDAVECMNYARSKGAKVVNASWGWYGENSASLRDAINSLRSAGIIFVAATGNDGSNNDTRPLYPASFDLDNIVAVAATTRFDEKADWSNYGATTVDLGAPAQDILSCWNTTDSTYHYLSGTSQCVPHVVGACALLGARNPSATYRQVIDRLLSSTDPLPSLSGKCVSGGRLNLQTALATPIATTPPPTTSSSSSSGLLGIRPPSLPRFP
jgi:subtilisin family serine protease